MSRKTGILGGTFNPVHIGHLILARDALEAFNLDEVLFVPCASPPHKRVKKMAGAVDRVKMLKAALRGDSCFRALTLEIERGGASYSIDTLRTLREQYPDDRFYFIIGADMLLEIHTWKAIYDLLELCEFVTMDRPGCASGKLANSRINLKAPWPKILKKNIFKGHLVEVSSTEIRQRVRTGKSIRHLVPGAVERYIYTHQLYKRELRKSKR